jgi:hypothetical protein
MIVRLCFIAVFQSVVLITRLPFVALFSQLVNIIAPEYFDNGEPSLEAGKTSLSYFLRKSWLVLLFQ